MIHPAVCSPTFIFLSACIGQFAKVAGVLGEFGVNISTIALARPSNKPTPDSTHATSFIGLDSRAPSDVEDRILESGMVRACRRLEFTVSTDFRLRHHLDNDVVA